MALFIIIHSLLYAIDLKFTKNIAEGAGLIHGEDFGGNKNKIMRRKHPLQIKEMQCNRIGALLAKRHQPSKCGALPVFSYGVA